MHLVKREEMVRASSRQIGGFVGWVMEWAQVLWASAKMRREARKNMRVIESLSIGGRKQLLLVSCGGEQFLVGTGADSVQTIVRVQAGLGSDERPQMWGFGEQP